MFVRNVAGGLKPSFKVRKRLNVLTVRVGSWRNSFQFLQRQAKVMDLNLLHRRRVPAARVAIPADQGRVQ